MVTKCEWMLYIVRPQTFRYVRVPYLKRCCKCGLDDEVPPRRGASRHASPLDPDLFRRDHLAFFDTLHFSVNITER